MLILVSIIFTEKFTNNLTHAQAVVSLHIATRKGSSLLFYQCDKGVMDYDLPKLKEAPIVADPLMQLVRGR